MATASINPRLVLIQKQPPSPLRAAFELADYGHCPAWLLDQRGRGCLKCAPGLVSMAWLASLICGCLTGQTQTCLWRWTTDTDIDVSCVNAAAWPVSFRPGGSQLRLTARPFRLRERQVDFIAPDQLLPATLAVCLMTSTTVASRRSAKLRRETC